LVAGFAIFLATSAAPDTSIGAEETLPDNQMNWAEDAKLLDVAPNDIPQDVDLELETELGSRRRRRRWGGRKRRSFFKKIARHVKRAAKTVHRHAKKAVKTVHRHIKKAAKSVASAVKSVVGVVGAMFESAAKRRRRAIRWAKRRHWDTRTIIATDGFLSKIDNRLKGFCKCPCKNADVNFALGAKKTCQSRDFQAKLFSKNSCAIFDPFKGKFRASDMTGLFVKFKKFINKLHIRINMKTVKTDLCRKAAKCCQNAAKHKAKMALTKTKSKKRTKTKSKKRTSRASNKRYSALEARVKKLEEKVYTTLKAGDQDQLVMEPDRDEWHKQAQRRDELLVDDFLETGEKAKYGGQWSCW
jgi:flagellar biosynthesis chaperone FliJ